MKDLLYGKDGTKNIVGVIPHDDESVMVFMRRDDGTVRPYVEKSWSMFLTTKEGADKAKTVHVPEWSGKRHMCVPLEQHEHAYYTHLILSTSRKNNRNLRLELVKTDFPTLNLGSTATQYLMQTGRTLMKGMNIDTVRRMQIDIETLSPNGGFPNAERDEDEIFIIAVTDNHGFRQVLHTGDDRTPNDEVYVKCTDEPDMLRKLVRLILMRDPDIIEGHNFFGFDMPYLVARYRKHKIEFAIGRNKRAPHSRSGAKIKFAEREIEYTQYTVSGRHIVDTFFLVCDFDVYKRAMPSYSLKDSAKFFDIARPERVYIDGDKLTQMWYEDPMKVLEYALDDVDETRGLSDKLLPSTFAMAQMVPNTLQSIHTGGVSRAIELLFLRNYILEKVGIPRPERGGQEFGGLTSVCYTGLVKTLWYIDVESLYPTIMLTRGVEPDSDYLKLFQRLLKLLTQLRLDTKARMNQFEEGTPEWVALDAEQASYKKLINSFYGYLGFKDAKFNDISEADRVATTGQSILMRMVDVTTKLGCTLIECDTDGILVQPPKGREKDNARKFVKEEVEPRMPKGIKLDLDGVFEVMLSYKSKNYALIDKKGKVKIKGGAFKNRGIEKFGRAFMKNAVTWMLKGEWEKIKVEYDNVCSQILNKQLSVEQFAVRKNLKMTLQEYEDSLKENGGNSNRAAQYEIWKQNTDRFDAGDAITYWIKAHDRRQKAVRAFMDARLIDDYEPGTENTAHYLKRLKEIVSKFDVFFDEESFGILFDHKTSNQQSLFEEPVDFESIVCPVVQVKTVDELNDEMQRNLARYAQLYN